TCALPIWREACRAQPQPPGHLCYTPSSDSELRRRALPDRQDGRRRPYPHDRGAPGRGRSRRGAGRDARWDTARPRPGARADRRGPHRARARGRVGGELGMAKRRASSRQRLRSATAASYGGVLYRRNGERYEIALVGRSAQGTWGLPKGTPSEGETMEQTALREVAEETGIEPRLVEPIGQIQYYFVARNTRFHKTVAFFLMEEAGGDVAKHDHEYDLVQWFDLDEAVDRLSYPNEAEMVRRAREMLLGSTAGRGEGEARSTG